MKKDNIEREVLHLRIKAIRESYELIEEEPEGGERERGRWPFRAKGESLFLLVKAHLTISFITVTMNKKL